MREFRYLKVDAFTAGESLGNPAACLFLEPGQVIGEADMLFIARQHKGFVSEVVYCEQPAPGRYKLTYYSSECEVDFCGHGTIACMYSLIKNNAALRQLPEIAVDTNQKGEITVYNRLADKDAVYISAPAPDYIGTEISKSEVAAALGLPASALAQQFPLDIIDAGLKTLIVPVEKFEDTVNVFPDLTTLRTFCERAGADTVLIFCRETASDGHIAHTRVFPPKFGYLEDPATGSGNSAFGYYMLKNGMWGGEPASIEQGGADRVFNTVELMVKDNVVLFGGGATTRIEGTYYL